MGRIYESAEKVVVWLGGLPAEVGRDESLAIEVEEAHGRIVLGQMPRRFGADGFGMEAVMGCDAGCAMEAAWRGSACDQAEAAWGCINRPAFLRRLASAHFRRGSSVHLPCATHLSEVHM